MLGIYHYMKYIITESRLNDTIKKFITENFSVVYDVFFSKHNVVLGSTKGEPTIEETRINIIINNSENKLNIRELEIISQEIRKSVERYFSLDYTKYGSGWDFNIKQLAIVSIQQGLRNI